jgi:two-component system cell cycle sensor histidine kinase/response regulator CckA
MSDPRITALLDQLQRMADGDLSYRAMQSDAGDDLDAVVVGLNMLAEELDRQAHDRRVGQVDRDVVEMFERAPVMLCAIDLRSGAVRRANAIMVQRHGNAPDDVLGVPLGEHVDTSSLASFEDALDRLRRGDHVENRDLRFVTKDGAPYSALFAATCAPSRNGDEDRAHCILLDVEDRRQLELQLVQAQKMEAVGRLAGAVAHDFNNVLTVMQSEVELALHELGRNNPVRSGLQDALEASRQASGLANKLLSFAREQIVDPRSLNLNDTLGSDRRMLERALGERVELEMELADELWPIRIDPSQIEQVLLNLVVNAGDAMPGGGRLRIETTNVSVDDTLAGPDADAGNYVRLSVADTGTGIAQDVQLRVFEPFFTTKAPDRGTGLGLSTCYGIVSQAGGFIRLHSELDHGTRFDLYFPRDVRPDATAEAATPEKAEDVGPTGTETILLLEDNEMVRQVIVRILAGAGYDIEEASRGDAALDKFEADPARYDMLLTDVMVPGMTGPQVVGAIRRQAPSIPVLLVSGYADDTLHSVDALGPGVHFMQKPFRPAALLAKVRAVLDDPSD